MAFIVEKMTLEDESFVYSERNNIVIRRFGSILRNESITTMDHWLIDSERNIYFLRLRNIEVMPIDNNFLLNFHGELIVIQVQSRVNPTVKIKYIPESLNSNIVEIQQLILDAFEVGGYYCRGIIDEVVDFISPRFEKQAGDK